MEEQDYVERTLNAYNQDHQKFETATKDMTPFPEMEAFIKLLPTSTEPVVDAGCAFGRDTVEISNRCDNEVIGIDMAIKFLERARALYPKLSFEKMDVRKLEFESHSIAGIWSHATLLHLKDEDVQTALSEFARVLVSHGALFVSFKEGEGEEEIVEKFSSNGSRFYRYQTEGSLKDLLTSSGFEINELYTINEHERWGEGYRNLNWVYALARKA